MRYVGRIHLSGSTTATATIDDLDLPDWQGVVRDIAIGDFQPGVVTVRILDGRRSGLFAVGELRYEDGAAVVIGRTAFGEDPRPPS